MVAQKYLLHLPQGRSIASAQVVEKGNRLTGTLEWFDAPAFVRRAFAEFESLVENQVLSLLDEAEEKIAAIDIRAIREEDAVEFRTVDLQIYPGERAIGFQLGDRVDHPSLEGPVADYSLLERPLSKV